MRKLIFFIPVLLCVYFKVYAVSINSVDSVGVTTIEGGNYIVHEVETGETLFGLSRKYNVHVQLIRDANADALTNLKIGQKVLIPIEKSQNDEETIHVVKSSETLFSISRQYNVKVDEVKKWNNLQGNSISVGQRLIIKEGESASSIQNQNYSAAQKGWKTHTVEQSQTLYSISRMYDVSTAQLREWNHLGSNDLDIGQVLIVSKVQELPSSGTDSNSSMLPKVSDNKIKSVQNNVEESVTSDEIPAPGATMAKLNNQLESSEELNHEEPVEKVVQKGLAEVIENTSDTKKYLALHRDAPIGTIMQVRNQMNNQSVFVRIVGKIPPTGDNAKVILKISKKAYDRLGAVDNRFPVELSYIP